MPQDDPKRQPVLDERGLARVQRAGAAADVRRPVLDERGLAGAGRVVWAVCIATYLIVFIGGIQAGASDLGALGRAMGFTLGAAILGRIAIGLLSRATQPLDKGPTASQDGTVGSRVDLLSSPNTPAQDEAAAA